MTVDSDLLAKAKEHKINILATLEVALSEALRQKTAENKFAIIDAIDSVVSGV